MPNIVYMGPIASGKSRGSKKASEIIQKITSIETVHLPENFRGNPYLPNYYKLMEAHGAITKIANSDIGYVIPGDVIRNIKHQMNTVAYMTQIWFLQSRRRMALRGKSDPRIFISDSHIIGDKVFAKVQRDMGIMDLETYLMYREINELCMYELGDPEILIHTTARVEVLMYRIRKRALEEGRPMELAIPTDYIERLVDKYNRTFEKFKGFKIILDTSDLDIEDRDCDFYTQFIKDNILPHIT